MRMKVEFLSNKVDSVYPVQNRFPFLDDAQRLSFEGENCAKICLNAKCLRLRGIADSYPPEETAKLQDTEPSRSGILGFRANQSQAGFIYAETRAFHFFRHVISYPISPSFIFSFPATVLTYANAAMLRYGLTSVHLWWEDGAAADEEKGKEVYMMDKSKCVLEISPQGYHSREMQSTYCRNDAAFQDRRRSYRAQRLREDRASSSARLKQFFKDSSSR